MACLMQGQPCILRRCMLSLSSPCAPLTTALEVAFGALGGGEEGLGRGLGGSLRLTAVAHRRAEKGGGGRVGTTALPFFRPPPPVPARCTLVRWSRAAAVAVCFEKNTALSRGWCMPLARGSAVCEQNASHNTQILACFSDQLD